MDNKALKPLSGKSLPQAVQSARRRIANKEKRAAERELRKLEEARDLNTRRWQSADARAKKQEAKEMRWAHSLFGTVIHNQTAVLRSLGRTERVQASVSRSRDVHAFTDFSRIKIEWPLSKFPKQEERDKVSQCVAAIRGVFQHEMGHLLYTVPFPTLQELSNEKNLGLKGYHHTVWNLLEDQRMEAKLVHSVPRIASYLTETVSSVLLEHEGSPNYRERLQQLWIMVAGRDYLSDDLRSLAYSTYAGELDKDEWLRAVNRYKTATTSRELIEATIAAYNLFATINDTLPLSKMDETGSRRGGGTGAPDEEAMDQKAAQGASGESEVPTTKEGDPSSDVDSDAVDSDAVGNGWTEDEIASNIEKVAEAVKQEREQALETVISNDGRVIEEWINEANERNNSTGLLDYLGGSPMDPDDLKNASAAAVGIRNVLEEFVTTSQPSWLSHQDEGIIDPLSFRTKNVGDLDYHRGLSGEPNQGLDLHVSLLYDVSISMGHYMDKLSQAMYACRVACDDLGVGSTSVIWSSGSETYRVWEGEKCPPPTLFKALGGTDPTMALDDVRDHNEEGASDHIVLIFTDGIWNDSFPSLQTWNDGSMRFVLLSYGVHGHLPVGADIYASIDSVLDIPVQLSQTMHHILTTR